MTVPPKAARSQLYYTFSQEKTRGGRQCLPPRVYLLFLLPAFAEESALFLAPEALLELFDQLPLL